MNRHDGDHRQDEQFEIRNLKFEIFIQNFKFRISNFFAKWDHFWLRPSPPHLLALLRIAFGLFLLLYWGLQWPGVPAQFSQEGIVIPALEPSHAVRLLIVPATGGGAQLLFGAFLLCLAAFTAGFLFRASCVLSLLFSFYYWLLSLHLFGTSYDHLFLFILLVLCCSDAHHAFSLDMRLRHGSWRTWEAANILPQRLIALQITAVYLGVGLQKLLLPGWQSGEVLAVGFTGRWATPLAWWVIRQPLPIAVYDAAVFLVKSLEIVLPVAFWIRRLRWWAFAGGALFHIGIALLLGIWWFLVLIPAYIVFFEPEEVQTKLFPWKG